MYITDCSAANPAFISLFGIFKATLKPDMTFREFRAYYSSPKLEYIDVTFVMLSGEIIGFCSAAFYLTTINDERYTIGRAATGILEGHRGHTLPKWALYKKYMVYWRKHPFHRIILSAYVANPLIYAMICKYTAIAYPRAHSPAPDHIVHIKDDLLRSQHLDTREATPFVDEIHFCVAMGNKELSRIFRSTDKNVCYFLKINPHFRKQHGVIVIIPIHLGNILLSSLIFFYYINLKYLTWLWHKCSFQHDSESNGK